MWPWWAYVVAYVGGLAWLTAFVLSFVVAHQSWLMWQYEKEQRKNK